MRFLTKLNHHLLKKNDSLYDGEHSRIETLWTNCPKGLVRKNGRKTVCRN